MKENKSQINMKGNKQNSLLRNTNVCFKKQRNKLIGKRCKENSGKYKKNCS